MGFLRVIGQLKITRTVPSIWWTYKYLPGNCVRNSSTHTQLHIYYLYMQKNMLPVTNTPHRMSFIINHGFLSALVGSHSGTHKNKKKSSSILSLGNQQFSPPRRSNTIIKMVWIDRTNSCL
jgi:hypothetical protein